MDEVSFTKTLKKRLEERDYYIKKLADRSTRGIPDSIYCKQHKAFMGEIKFFEVTYTPTEFKRWSALKPNGKLVQLTTMVQFDNHFLARYIFGFHVKETNELLLCKIVPSVLLAYMQIDKPYELPKLMKIDLFLDDLDRFLQLPESL